ncbi:MAG: hypothetical protein IH999_11895 [Proteobacteria bacterium]|nr:hypothetical protein [Pseudomonadota bacterium]
MIVIATVSAGCNKTGGIGRSAKPTSNTGDKGGVWRRGSLIAKYGRGMGLLAASSWRARCSVRRLSGTLAKIK